METYFSAKLNSTFSEIHVLVIFRFPCFSELLFTIYEQQIHLCPIHHPLSAYFMFSSIN
jgi:hypothetical protein